MMQGKEGVLCLDMGFPEHSHTCPSYGHILKKLQTANVFCKLLIHSTHQSL